MRIVLLQFLVVGCAAQISQNWVWSETQESPSSSQGLMERFNLDSGACLERANSSPGGPGRFDPPVDRDPLDPLLQEYSEWDAAEWDEWNSEYESCMSGAGWTLR